MGTKRDPEREKLPVLLTPSPPSYQKIFKPLQPGQIYANLSICTQGAAFTGLRFFTAPRRMPPARPAAIRRAFLLEELSYPPTSDPLSSGLGLAAVSFSPDTSCFMNFPPSDRNNPMNQVFLNEARVALDASKRMSSPSSAYARGKKVGITNCRPGPVNLRGRHLLPLQPCQSSSQGLHSLPRRSDCPRQGSL